MTKTTASPHPDLETAKKALRGDAQSVSKIHSSELVSWLVRYLIGKGASSSEAEDIIADLFADCFSSAPPKQPLLLQYQGQGPLRAFLARSAMNRLLDYKRHSKVKSAYASNQSATASFDLYENLEPDQDALVKLLKDAIANAYSQCSARDLVILRLVIVYGVNQKSVGNMLGWSQSKVSRLIADTISSMRRNILSELEQTDPWLTIEWTDFLSLCQSTLTFSSHSSASHA